MNTKCEKCGGEMKMEGDMMKCTCGNTKPAAENQNTGM